MKLIRNYFDVLDVCWGEETKLEKGILSIKKEELDEIAASYTKHIEKIEFEIVKPGEDTRIIHILDTVQPMYKVDGSGKQYPGILSNPMSCGEGVTNLLWGFTVMESAPLPWEVKNASSGLLYPRDAILDMSGPYAEITPFSKTSNLVITYELKPEKSSAEYDNDIRRCAMRISEHLAKVTEALTPDWSEEFSIDNRNSDLPNVVLVWQCQNQGVYANTLLYGKSIDNLVPTILHPNEMLDGCIVSGNYAWPAFKVPTYLHVNHPILLELYKRHGKELNFAGIIFSRSHNPTHWDKERSANICVKLARVLKADGLVMAWEGGGNAATDGMLTIQEAERRGIRAAAITFEFGGKDGTEGILLVDDVPEADTIISGGSIEKTESLPAVSKVVGGEFLRLNKEMGGYFPPAKDAITFENNTQLYCAGNQSGHGRLTAHAY